MIHFVLLYDSWYLLHNNLFINSDKIYLNVMNIPYCKYFFTQYHMYDNKSSFNKSWLIILKTDIIIIYLDKKIF